MKASVNIHVVLICLQGNKGELIGVTPVPALFVDFLRYMPSLRQDKHHISSSQMTGALQSGYHATKMATVSARPSASQTCPSLLPFGMTATSRCLDAAR
jgi:hypothetical protein